MEHPDPKCQKIQEEFLKNCPEDEKEFHERFFRIGNAAYVYHQRVTSINDKVQEEYYHEWLEGLPETIRKDMQNKGFGACKTMVPFTRYVNERSDIGINDWMKDHLSKADFEYWLDMGKS